TGRGFYDYGKDATQPDPNAHTDATPASAIVVPHSTPALDELLGTLGIKTTAQDDGESPILIAPIGQDCSSYIHQHDMQQQAARVIAIDVLGDTSQRVTLMTAPGADNAVIDAVVAALKPHRKVCVIKDSPGFVGPRMAAMVANLGCEMARTGVAGIEDIATAM